MTFYRLLIVDDHPIVLTGLRLLLAGSSEFRLVGEATTAAEARASAERLQPDLIITDLVMGGADGIALVEDLVAIAPAAVLVYSSHDERQWAPRVLRVGARGFVSKAEPLDAVEAALFTLIQGEIHISAEVQRALVSDYAECGAGAADIASLSGRELQVLTLMGKGLGLQALSATLGLSVKTVGTYRERLKVKLGLESVRMLERVAHDQGKPQLPS